MKKIFIIIMLFAILIVTGCGKDTKESVFKDLTNKINKLDGYTVSGVLEVKNNNNNYNYDVSVSFMKSDKYRVSLINTSNNHEQVILRNDDGVFVLTPSLNKSFKFQSDWPYNNSQVYILSSIMDDLNKDSEMTKEERDGKYVFTSKVNYPNNNKLVSQRVTVTSDLFIESVEVLNEQGEVEMKFTVNKTDYNPTFDESYFEVNSIINTTNNNSNNTNTNNENNSQNSNTNNNNNDNTKTTCSQDDNCESVPETNEKNTNQSTTNNKNTNSENANKTSATMNGFLEDDVIKTAALKEEKKDIKKEDVTPTATLQDIIYPLYLPTGTVLKDQEKVSKTDGERVILTFAGDKGFTLVEETSTREKEFTIIPTYGEPGLINDTIGAITDNSLNWISNGVEYYMVSDVMNTIELLDIANSINVTAVANLK